MAIAHECDDEKDGPCGKFSTLRIVTHKLRHCKKAAQDVRVPVSSQCCRDLATISMACLHATFSSDAFQKAGLDPEIARTIPVAFQPKAKATHDLV
ncbi:hypothetical protein Fmac_005333 [Flemingia macrophylla]|uniref:Bifunctional inhibitor/plant lipid transfer protein/seed storage helical domain-containing protein n=1 Tax=Flemingia macrophylla TaxID=520843 RepID=A0ABD1N7T8_9FABA